MHDIYRLVLEQRRAQGLGFPLDFIWLCDRIHNPLWILSNDVVWRVIFSLSASEEFHLCRELSSGSSSFLSLSHFHHLDGLSDMSNQRPVPLVRLKVISRWSCSPLRLYFLSHQGSILSMFSIHPECSETTQVVSEMHKRFVCVCVCVCVYVCVCVRTFFPLSVVFFKRTGMQPRKIKKFIIVVKDLHKFINSTC